MNPIMNQTLKPARLPHRFIAAMIDLVIISLVWGLVSVILIFTLVYSFAQRFAELGLDSDSLATNPTFILVAVLLVILAYSFSFHMYFISLESKSGQTVGKKMMRIKVVSIDGSPITKKQAIYRDFAKIYFELTLTIPLIYIFMNEKRQRLGDKWAKTIVIESL